MVVTYIQRRLRYNAALNRPEVGETVPDGVDAVGDGDKPDYFRWVNG
jgi:hypothetical protein